MQRFFRALTPISLCLMLAACPSAVRPPQPAPELPPAPLEQQGAVSYEIDSAAASVNILVYRGGTLAKLGHNHVVTSKTVTGRVWVHPELEKTGFELAFPVAQLIVDDPAARRSTGGSEFPPDIPQADREGTRKNMLRAEVLDAEQFPQITLRSVAISGTMQAPRITTRITIKSVSQDVVVPTSVTLEGSRLTASGEFEILQTSFGIKPFSVGLGALQVQDKLRIKFQLVANRAG